MFRVCADGAGHHDEPADNRRVRPVNVSLTVTLSEVYNGCTKRVRVQRQRLCDPCKGMSCCWYLCITLLCVDYGRTVCAGTGAKDPSKGASQCGQCRGRGVMLARTIMGMMQMECDACDGSGQSIAARDRCPSCRGEKIGEQTATLNVEIPRGAADGQRLVLSGEGHAVPGITAGDVAVLLTIEKHETMTRHGDILVVDQQVTLRDALCGGSFEFTHLDGRKLRIVSKRGETIQPGSLKCVENEGMPKLSNSFFKGHLVFRFSVVFPQHMDEASIASLEAMLPATAKKDKTPSKQSDEVEECHLSEFDKALLEVKPSKSHGHEDDDEDDEHMRARMGGMGGGGAQCRQM
jgi:DnaJ family protein A protein 2